MWLKKLLNKKRDGLEAPTMLPGFVLIGIVCGWAIINYLEKYVYNEPVTTLTKVLIYGGCLLLWIGVGILQIYLFCKSVDENKKKNETEQENDGNIQH